MKRIALYLGIAAALLASCSTQEMDFQTPVQEEVEYYAYFEQPAEEGTRVYANENLLLRWTADDRVSIFGKSTYNQQYKFLGETGDNAGGFSKVDGAEYVTGNPISHTVSVYPYQESTKITEDEILTVTLPAVQNYAENTFGLGANTMVSVSEDNFLEYKNVGGYLKLRLYGEYTSIRSITLRGNNGEKLAGKASVTMPVDGLPAVKMADDATDTITLFCENGVDLRPTAEESVDFWFVVPPVTFSKGFTITVTTNGLEPFTKSTEKSLTIERNTLSKMAPIEVLARPKNVIYYQSSSGDRIIPYSPAGFGANIVSNELIGNGWGALTFDDEITSIGWYAFYNCTDLIAIQFPESVTSIGGGVFKDCTQLFYALIPLGVTRIEAATFQGCTRLTRVYSLRALDNVTSIGDAAFEGCKNLIIDLPAGLTNIGKNAFADCTSLKSVTLPAGVTSIGDYAFLNCNQLTKITALPDTPPAGGSNMFYNTNDCPIFVPAASVDNYKSASGWSDYADRIQASHPTLIRYTSSDGNIVEPFLPQGFGATVISNVYAEGQGVITLDGVVTILGEAVFSDCTTLTSIQIPESVVRIENWSFARCTSLASVSLPEKLARIGYGVFQGCSSLESISMPNQVTEIGLSAFQGCTSLKTMSIPDGVTVIESGTFQGCSSLESISIPENVTTISQYAFQGCSSLTTVTLPPSLRMIDALTFSDCTSLSSVTIPESVSTIRTGAFQNCTALTSITIPKDVNEMNHAFRGCTGLKTVTMLPYYPPSASGAFGSAGDGSMSEDFIIFVPEGRAEAYKSARYWRDLADRIYEIGTPIAVDLGLSVKWASFNLGATMPEEYGDYYAWGETEPYYSSLDPLTWKEGKESGYAWTSYKWCMGSYDTMTKYCPWETYGYNGYSDDKTVLDLEDDAASVNLGGSWRTPTDEEWTELRETCTWTRTSMNGVNGLLITASNGNSIFLPAAGHLLNTNLESVGSGGCYWTSSLRAGGPGLPWYAGFDSGAFYRDYDNRFYGFSVRPVTE